MVHACILAVGSEMLTPFRVDTNSLVITERLNAIGYDVRLKAVVADHVDELARVLEGALSWADLVIVTGGLGPTEDDVTRDAVAHAVYGKWTTADVPISTTILAALGQIELHLTARAANRAAADAALDAAVGELQSALGSSIYGTDGRPLEAVLGGLLRERKL